MLEAVFIRPMVFSFSWIRGIIKFTFFFLTVLEYILHHELVKLIIRDENNLYRYYLKSVRRHARFGLWLLNIKVEDHAQVENINGLLISNHLSYLDVLVLFSKYPSLFITSREIRDVFLLGRMTKLAGCFHVERRKHLRTELIVRQEMDSMKEKLISGFSLFLFPEGTSSDGSSVLPFKAHFFQTVIDLNMPVHAFCLKYHWKNSSDEVCWYGDMTFAPHLFNVCCQKQISADLQAIKYERGEESDRFKIASDLHLRIKEMYEEH